MIDDVIQVSKREPEAEHAHSKFMEDVRSGKQTWGGYDLKMWENLYREGACNPYLHVHAGFCTEGPRGFPLDGGNAPQWYKDYEKQKTP